MFVLFIKYFNLYTVPGYITQYLVSCFLCNGMKDETMNYEMLQTPKDLTLT